MIFEGRVWKFGDNISTDFMMPGTKVLATPGITDEEASQYCMSTNRPDWAARVQKGDIIVAGSNWGTGSSRPAARLLKALNISVVVANSIGRVFFRNAINIGLPALMCSGVSQAFDEGDIARVNVETGEVTNVTKGVTLQGEALPADSPPMQILRAGGLNAFMHLAASKSG